MAVCSAYVEEVRMPWKIDIIYDRKHIIANKKGISNHSNTQSATMRIKYGI